MAEFITTTELNSKLRDYVKTRSRQLRLCGIRPEAVILLASGNKSDLSYLDIFSWADVNFNIINMKKSSYKEWIARITEYANDEKVHSIIIEGMAQNINMQELYNMIPIEKDAICNSIKARAGVLCGEKLHFLPPVCETIMSLFRECKIPYCRKHIVIYGNGNDVRLLAYCLLNAGAFVTVCNEIKGTKVIGRSADIVIAMKKVNGKFNKDYSGDWQTIIDFESGHID